MLIELWLLTKVPLLVGATAGALVGYWGSPRLIGETEIGGQERVGQAAIAGFVGWLAYDWSRTSLISFFIRAEENGTRAVSDFSEQALVHLRVTEGWEAFAIAAVMAAVAFERAMARRNDMAGGANTAPQKPDPG